MRRGRLGGALAAVTIASILAGCAAYSVDARWVPRAQLEVPVELVETPVVAGVPTPDGLDVQQAHGSGTSAISARWAQIPGNAVFNTALTQHVRSVIADHTERTGVPFKPGLLPEVAPSPAPEASFLTVDFDIVAAGGSVLAERVRASSSDGSTETESSSIFYTDAAGEFVTTSDALITDSGLRLLLQHVVESLKIERGAFVPAMQQSLDDFPLDGLRKDFSDISFAPGGAMQVRLPDGFTTPEIDRLAAPAVAPGGTEPDGTQPDGTEPDGTEPEGTQPEGTAPDGTAPDPSPPGPSATGVAPDETASEDPAPDDAAAGQAAPDATGSRTAVIRPEAASAMLTEEGRAVQDALGGGEPLQLPPATGRSDQVDCALVSCVALTFDDGPGPYTESVLNALKARNAVATFYMVGGNVVQRPALVKRMQEEGHGVANHTWSHPQLPTLSPGEIASQVQRTSNALTAITGEPVTTFRPPYGAIDGKVSAAAGLPAILWSVDTLDWQKPGDAVLLERAVEWASPGGIILCHDVHESTTRMVPAIIDGLIARGFTLVTVDQLLATDPPGPRSIVRSAGAE